MLAELDADGFKAAQVHVLDVGRRRLENHLILKMFVQAIGVFAVTAIRRAARGLHIRDAIRCWAENAQERFRVHGARANFGVVGLLEDATLVSPEVHEFENETLKGKAGDFLLKFYFSFQEASKSWRIASLRSA